MQDITSDHTKSLISPKKIAGESVMQLLPLTKLGAHEIAPGILHFGLYLPNVTAVGGYSISIKVINEEDQFLQAIKPLQFDLISTPDADFPGGDYWTVQVDTSVAPPGETLPAGSRWGRPGRYVYRYLVS